jgi:hypothetical protein
LIKNDPNIVLPLFKNGITTMVEKSGLLGLSRLIKKVL